MVTFEQPLTLLIVTRARLTNCILPGDAVGQKTEDEFTTKAKQSGMTDEEAKFAFNSNMMATGLLSEYPAEFAKQNGRRWLVSSYEAGDVVLHKPHAVCPAFYQLAVCSVSLISIDPCIDHQQRPGQCYPAGHGPPVL